MKLTALAIARATAHVGKTLPAAEIPALLDAAASLLITHGLLKGARTFGELLKREWLREEGAVAVTLTTTSGSAGKAKDDIESLLRSTLKQKYVFEERADPRLIGGMLLSVGDERFDVSLRGALTDLALTLTAPIPVS